MYPLRHDYSEGITNAILCMHVTAASLICCTMRHTAMFNILLHASRLYSKPSYFWFSKLQVRYTTDSSWSCWCAFDDCGCSKIQNTKMTIKMVDKKNFQLWKWTEKWLFYIADLMMVTSSGYKSMILIICCNLLPQL